MNEYRKLLIFLFYYISSILSSYAQENITFSLDENTLKDIHIFNKDSAIVIGTKGKVLKTFNGGEKWIFQDIPTGNGINDVYFVNNKSGWGVGEYGTIIKQLIAVKIGLMYLMIGGLLFVMCFL